MQEGCCFFVLIGTFIGAGQQMAEALRHEFLPRGFFVFDEDGVIEHAVLFRGIVNISGRFTSLDTPYWIAGWIFIGLALVSEILYLLPRIRRT